MTRKGGRNRISTNARRGLLAFLLLIVLSIGFATRYQVASSNAAPRDRRKQHETSHEQNPPGPAVLFGSPGRVEPADEIVSVGAAFSGVLAAVNVHEGQFVKAGQTLATLFCEDTKAELAEASALVDSARQARYRLLRGSREEERRESADHVTAAQALALEAHSRYQRTAQLLAKDEISRQDSDRARTEMETAEANLRAAQQRKALTNAEPLPEEVAEADAKLRAKEEREKSLMAKLEQCSIRAPIAGILMRRPLQPGESFSLAIPKPIALLADASHLRVRAEVDERDIGLVHVGQQAIVSADAFPGEEFLGKVSKIEALMGRKNVWTGDPTEKSDRDVLEVLIDLADRQDHRNSRAGAPSHRNRATKSVTIIDSYSAKTLAIGLRVAVQFLQ